MKRFNFVFILLFCLLLGNLAFAQTLPCFEAGMTSFYSQDWPGAISNLEKAIVEDPYNALAFSFLLDAHIRANTIDAFINKVEGQVVEGGEDPLGQVHLGLCYFAKGMMGQSTLYEDAINEFKAALKADPNMGMAHTGLGMVYFQKRMIPRAKGHLLKALSINKNDLMAIELLGNILLVDEKQPDIALKYFELITQLAPSYPDGYYYVGSSFCDLKEYESAITYLQKAMELDPSGLTQGYYAPVLIADIYYLNGDMTQAKTYYEHALKINEDNPYVKYKIDRIAHPEKYEKNDKAKDNK